MRIWTKKKDIELPPIMKRFYELNGRVPTHQELKQFIHNVVMPSHYPITKKMQEEVVKFQKWIREGNQLKKKNQYK